MGEHEIDAPPARRAVFLDRDGVLNKAIVRNGKPFPPSSIEEFELLPAVREACDLLRDCGFLLVVVTNQPDVGRGTQTLQMVQAINARMGELLCVDQIYVCYDSGENPSTMRKPSPGMIIAASKDLGIDISESYMVGDRWRDIDAGKAAGCAATFFVNNGYDEKLKDPPDFVVGSFREAASLIIQLHNSLKLS